MNRRTHRRSCKSKCKPAARKPVTRAREAIAQKLQKDGIDIAPGGYTLKVRLGVVDTGDSFDKDPSLLGKTTIPKVMIAYNLFNPEGKEIWHKVAEEYWLYERSKYRLTPQEARRRGRRTRQPGQPMQQMMYFDFSGGDPFTLMAEELKEYRGDLEWLHALPKMLKGGADFGVPAAVDAPLKDLEQLLIKHSGKRELPADELAAVTSELTAQKDHPDLSKWQREVIGELLEPKADSMRIDSQLRRLQSEAQIIKSRGPPKLAAARPTKDDWEREAVTPKAPNMAEVGLLARLALPKDTDVPMAMTFTPDGKELHVVARGRLLKYEFGAKRWASSEPLSNDDYEKPIADVSDDFSRAVYSEQRETVTLVDTKDFSETTFKMGRVERVQHVKLSPDGKYLACTTTKNAVRVWDLKTEKVVLETTIENAPLRPVLLFSQDGALFVIVDEKIRIFNAKTFKPQGEAPNRENDLPFATFLSADASLLMRLNLTEVTAWDVSRQRGAWTVAEPVRKLEVDLHHSRRGDVSTNRRRFGVRHVRD